MVGKAFKSRVKRSRFFIKFLSALIFLKSACVIGNEEWYLSNYNLNRLNELKSSKTPAWMNTQIEEDFSPFEKNRISLDKINGLYQHLTSNFPFNAFYVFVRFRIIGNNIYIYRPPNVLNYIYYKSMLVALQKAGRLPQVDFVLHYSDATPCEHISPDRYWIYEPGSGPSAPLLCYGKPADKSASLGLVHIPSCQFLIQHTTYINRAMNGSTRFPWNTKIDRAIWRGSITDFHVTDEDLARLSATELCEIYKTRPRYQVCELSQRYPDVVDAGFSHNGSYDVLNSLIAGKVVGLMSIEDQLQYKYLINLDGWGWPTNFIWGIASNSVCFKHEPGITDWFYSAFKPYEHYIPVKKDLSDLVEKVQWARSHDEECRQMAESASQILRNEVTNEHGLLYFYLVLQKYEQMQNFRTKDLRKKTIKDKNWVLVH